MISFGSVITTLHLEHTSVLIGKYEGKNTCTLGSESSGFAHYLFNFYAIPMTARLAFHSKFSFHENSSLFFLKE
jgi:hypothetical protein